MITFRYRFSFTDFWRISVLGLLLLGVGCAQVPRESVELSSTVGRDLIELRDSHVATVNLLFRRMKDEVNQFVDSQYAPFTIRELLQADMQDEEDSLTKALKDAASAPGEALIAMEIFVALVTAEIEDYRAELLAPILAQEAQALTDINDSYGRVLYANSIVTGHLASIVKVHDAQQEILDKVGLKDLRQSSGAAIVNASEKVGKLLEKAKKADTGTDEFTGLVQQIKDSFVAPKED